MRPRNQSQSVVVIEGLGDILAECVSCSTRGNAPSTSVIWVTPEKIAHRTLMGNLLYTIQRTDVIECVDRGTQATVKAENLIIDEGGEGEVVEEVSEVFPDIRIAILSKAFVVEPVHLGDLTRLVVSTEDGDAVGIADFEGNKEGNSLDRVVSTVNIVT